MALQRKAQKLILFARSHVTGRPVARQARTDYIYAPQRDVLSHSVARWKVTELRALKLKL